MTIPSSTWPWLHELPLLLASASATRAAVLRAAGLAIEPEPARIDERAIETPLRVAGVNAADRALALARAKALDVSQRHGGRLVLGADQTLDAAGHPGVKAANRAEAQAFLKALSGGAHALHSAAAIARDGAILFECVECAQLRMRRLDDAFITSYLDRTGDESMSSVGGYQIESIGLHLFDHIDGDHNVIRGLPLLPLLSFLRRIDAIAS